MDYYYDERISLLRCVASLLRNSQDENHILFEEAREAVERLLEAGLVTNILNLFQDLNKASVPKQHLVRYELS